MPEYMVGPLVAMGIFLATQLGLFLAFLWRQSLLLATVAQSQKFFAETYAEHCTRYNNDLQVVHDRITEHRSRIDRHSERLDDHGKQISHIKGVMGISQGEKV